MSKEVWVARHEKLISEFLEKNPETTIEEATELTIPFVDIEVSHCYAGMYRKEY
jgi:hypothetical protein